ncbi:VOC family protein [Pseudomonas aestuarii]
MLAVDDIARTVDIYQRVLGMRHEVFGQNRSVPVFGQQ